MIFLCEYDDEDVFEHLPEEEQIDHEEVIEDRLSIGSSSSEEGIVDADGDEIPVEEDDLIAFLETKSIRGLNSINNLINNVII